MKDPRAGWILVAVLLVGCGGDSSTSPPTTIVPPEPTSDPGSLLLEHPGGYCLPHDASTDTLWVHNRGTRTLHWVTESPPGSSTNLDGEFSVEPGTVAAVPWSWGPPGDSTAADSLVGLTSDPDAPRVTIPFRRVDANHVETAAPSAPAWVTADAETIRVGRNAPLEWTRVSDCAGDVVYRVQVSTSPDFPRGPSTVELNVGTNLILIEAEPQDVGVGYARVRVRAADFRVGGWSPVLTWIAVQDP